MVAGSDAARGKRPPHDAGAVSLRGIGSSRRLPGSAGHRPPVADTAGLWLVVDQRHLAIPTVILRQRFVPLDDVEYFVVRQFVADEQLLREGIDHIAMLGEQSLHLLVLFLQHLLDALLLLAVRRCAGEEVEAVIEAEHDDHPRDVVGGWEIAAHRHVLLTEEDFFSGTTGERDLDARKQLVARVRVRFINFFESDETLRHRRAAESSPW